MVNKTDAWRLEASLDDALEHGLSQAEFNLLTETIGRPLNMLEVGICSALFSEHCSYKSTKVHLKTLPTSGKHVIHGPGENAGVVDIGDGLAVVFKVESHNHPSFIEPFQGAATGVGGILRDVFTMGARPLANLNALRFGEPKSDKTRYLLRQCVGGIGTYGNCMGIPTVGGELSFHKSYNGNCLVNAFALGLVKHDEIFLGTASGVGNPVVYVGSKTGRDGIHGATMASESFGEDSESKRPTVQVGDPFQEKLLLEACLEAFASGAVVGVQDMGAAGMTSSSFEMAARGETGMRLDLDKVPARERGMNPYEIMLSESQERMLFVLQPDRVDEVAAIFKHWGLDSVQIGEVTGSSCVELFWEGECVSSLPVRALTESVPQYNYPYSAPSKKRTVDCSSDFSSISVFELLEKMTSSYELCSREPVYTRYDSTVRGNTVVHPGGDAAVIRVRDFSQPAKEGEKQKGVAISLDCDSYFCFANPYQGAQLSVIESYRNVVATGALPLALSDCLNFGNPQREEGMWEIAESIRGIGTAATNLETPVVSGNVSLYNETGDSSVLPTPMIAMVGLLEDAQKALKSTFAPQADRFLVLGSCNENDAACSILHTLEDGIVPSHLPEISYASEKSSADCVRTLCEKSLILSCHDVSRGGLLLALFESCGGSELRGLKLQFLRQPSSLQNFLVAETGARYLVSYRANVESEIIQTLGEYGVECEVRGEIDSGGVLDFGPDCCVPIAPLYENWKKRLNELLDL